MKSIFSLLTLVFLFISCQENTFEKDVLKHQYEQNLQFQNKEKSPLTAEAFEKFTALEFYTIDERFKVEALLTRTPDALVFEMPTTTTRKPLYKQYGILTFTIGGEKQELELYQSQNFNRDPMYKDYLFLPFTDKTSGQGSYGGGRYIDLLLTDEKDGKIIIDFNKAYNPYCAYSGRYSCPITPKQNHLTVAVKAGVKAYENH